MVLKRQLGGEEGEEGFQLPNKRRHLISNLFRGPNYARCMQDFVPTLEPIIRKWVQEAVESALSTHMRSASNQIESSGRRNIHLEFHKNLPRTLFTGSKIVADDGSRIEVALYDSVSRRLISSGPLSSSKLTIVALDGDFGPDDCADWSKQDFDRKTVKSREGKRPLITGELTVHLHGGVGYLGDITITDNSSWIRSGMFRLGAKVSADEPNVREGMSNAFKVKDHRGESYQKHYPPQMDDEVWRLEKIGKEGSFHKSLTKNGIHTVAELLRMYAMDPGYLRSVTSVSSKQWDTIIRHASTCALDDKKYVYPTSEGTSLLFDTVYRVVEVSFDGLNYHPIDKLNTYQVRKVDELKRDAYQNQASWILLDQTPIAARPMLLPSPSYSDPSMVYPNFLDQPNFGVEPESFDEANIGNSFAFENNNNSSNNNNSYMGSAELSIPIGGDFQVGATYTSGAVLLSSNNGVIDIGCHPSNGGMVNPRAVKPKARWCKVLAVVKWRILVKRNVAARKWRAFFCDM